MNLNPLIAHLLLLLLALNPARALDNGYGATPGMGWNSDYCTRCASPQQNGFGGERFVKHIATYLNESSLQAKGYRFVNMDASWDLPTRDPATGDLRPDPVLWPSGIKHTVDFVHSLGLGFGLYGDKGSEDCANNPGQLNHTTKDARFLARIGVDWWKEDSCHSSGTNAEQIAAYAEMRDALNATGRPVWFALCGWETFYATDSGGGQAIGNSWRIGPDTGTGWSAVMINARRGLAVAASGVPGPSKSGGGGAWSDGSLLLNPGMGSGAEAIDSTRSRTMFSLWCTLGFNLLMTGNLSALDPFVLETWGNPEMIRVNQDVAGHPPKVVMNGTTRTKSAGEADARGAPDYVQAHFEECGGEPNAQTWDVGTFADGFWRNAALELCLNVRDCASEIIYDSCTVTGPATSCAQKPDQPFDNERFDWHPDDGTLVTRLSAVAPNVCVTMDAAGKLSLQECPRPPSRIPPTLSQTFTYSNKTKQLTSNADGRCLTASKVPPPPLPSGADRMVIARQMADGDTVLLFLNDGNATSNVTCDRDCLAVALPGALPSEAAPYEVRDLWDFGDASKSSLLETPSLSVRLRGGGASSVFRLRKR
jgi:alpha-galactosidase